jgi:signal transduction histidine kinase
VVEAHQGKIGVNANPGGGSIFWLRIPQPEALD